FRVGLAADGVADLGGGHQVALVCGVDEDSGVVLLARLHLDGTNGSHGTDTSCAAGFLQPLTEDDGNLVLGQHVAQDSLRNVRLEGPHGVVGRAVAVVILALAGLPRLRPVVVLFHPLVEFAGDAADDCLVPRVGPPQPAGGHAADVLRRLDQYDRIAHACRLDRGGHAPSRSAVDTNVGVGE